MKKLLFLPLLVLALFTSCSKDDEENGPAATETEKMIFGNWKMHAYNYDYYNDNNEVVHNENRTNLDNRFEFKSDGTVRFKGEEAENWDSRKYVVEEDGTKKMIVILPANGNRAEATTIYTVENLTATDMVLTESYNFEKYGVDANGKDLISAKVEKKYEYSRM
ncbi:hypothetical protein [Pontibacter roseus]|uniref:hypothetical protein n=1 Tax=Pontibacter roseus TaxID=336989 RepID=UPI0003789F8F|nr:hypothetical protein [Pontibacter roseus]